MTSPSEDAMWCGFVASSIMSSRWWLLLGSRSRSGVAAGYAIRDAHRIGDTETRDRAIRLATAQVDALAELERLDAIAECDSRREDDECAYWREIDRRIKQRIEDGDAVR
jgi:hypothetical protein